MGFLGPACLHIEIVEASCQLLSFRSLRGDSVGIRHVHADGHVELPRLHDPLGPIQADSCTTRACKRPEDAWRTPRTKNIADACEPTRLSRKGRKKDLKRSQFLHLLHTRLHADSREPQPGMTRPFEPFLHAVLGPLRVDPGEVHHRPNHCGGQYLGCVPLHCSDRQMRPHETRALPRIARLLHSGAQTIEIRLSFKVNSGRISAQQTTWKKHLGASGVDTYEAIEAQESLFIYSAILVYAASRGPAGSPLLAWFGGRTI